MLGYDRIDLSEGLDTSTTGSSIEHIICHYWYFLRKNFRFKPKVCHSCHDLTQASMRNEATKK